MLRRIPRVRTLRRQQSDVVTGAGTRTISQSATSSVDGQLQSVQRGSRVPPTLAWRARSTLAQQARARPPKTDDYKRSCTTGSVIDTPSCQREHFIDCANTNLQNPNFANFYIADREFDSITTSTVSDTESTDRRMARTKQTDRKTSERFVCHVCQKSYKQHFGRKRHLGVQHRVDEANNKITEDEYQRLLSYNTSKSKRPNPKPTVAPTPESAAGSAAAATGPADSGAMADG